jgi:D-sedoheptulose 7-phosphate isomerase
MAYPPRFGHPDSAFDTFDVYFRSYLEDLSATMHELSSAAVARVARAFERARQEQRQIFVIGNGGSAATASHMAVDLGKGTIDYGQPGFTRFRTISLCDNSALITALGNDRAFEDIFTEQLASLMHDGDVVVFISASGNSPNLVRAAHYARARRGELVGLLGFGGGALASLVDHPLVVSSRNYGIAEDSHVIVQHVLTQFLRRLLAGPARPVAFLDRDGIINERPAPHHYVTSWDQFRWNEGIVPVLQGLATMGFALVVITNQQGVGKRQVSEATLTSMHAEMTRQLAADGIELARVLHCPHLAQERCFCRKPRPGLIYKALNDLPFLVDLAGSVVIGDSASDMEAGLAAGIGTRVLVGPDAVDTGEAATHRAAGLQEVLPTVMSALSPLASSVSA